MLLFLSILYSYWKLEAEPTFCFCPYFISMSILQIEEKLFIKSLSRSIPPNLPNYKHCLHNVQTKPFIASPWHLNEPRYDKTNKMSVRPAKTKISLGGCPGWSESSLCAQWVAKDPMFFHADSEDSDQTGRMPRLIWVFAGRTLTL